MTTPGSEAGPAATRRPLSLRTRLLLLLALALVPIAGERAFGLMQDRSERLVDAEAKMVQLARHAASTQQTLMDESRLFLTMLSRTLQGQVDTESCSATVQSYVGDVAWIRTVFITNAAGDVICSTRSNRGPVNIADRAYFQEAARTGDFTVSDYLLSKVERLPTVITALPDVDAGGRMQNLMVATLDLSAVGDRLATIARDGEVSLFMVDAKGVIVAAYPAGGRMVGQNISEFRVEDVDAPVAGILEGTNSEGTRLIIGFAPVRDTLFRIGISVPKSEVLAEVQAETLRSIAEFIVLGLVFGVAVWIGGERLLIRPAERLAQAAERFGAGDLRARATTANLPAELVAPAAAFNAMANRIAERDAALTEANKRLHELASQDGLTGLANRRHFDEALRKEWARAMRDRSPLAIASVDVDFFKRFNDCYGHLAGDDALRRVGEVLQSVARRPGDCAARIGGEEFAILLPQTSAAGAVSIAESARAIMEAAAVEHAESEVGRLTLSIGVAALVPSPEVPVVTLLSAADEALYAAKRGGRNRVTQYRSQSGPRLVAGA